MIVKLTMENNHRNSFIRTLIASFAFLLSFTAFAQSTFSIKVQLVDSKTAEPVSYATVSVSEKGKTEALKYVLSDINGAAEIAKVRKGTYVLKAELMGYILFIFPFIISRCFEKVMIKNTFTNSDG